MDASIHRVDERAGLLRRAVQSPGERRRRQGEHGAAFHDALRRSAAGEEDSRRREEGDPTGSDRRSDPDGVIAGPERAAAPFASATAERECESESGANLDVTG
jgi:hypothetical protein